MVPYGIDKYLMIPHRITRKKILRHETLSQAHEKAKAKDLHQTRLIKKKKKKIHLFKIMGAQFLQCFVTFIVILKLDGHISVELTVIHTVPLSLNGDIVSAHIDITTRS